jgi:hypothetical protein
VIRSATARGWTFCRQNPDPCVNSFQDKSIAQTFMMAEVNKLVWPAPHGYGRVPQSAYAVRTCALLSPHCFALPGVCQCWFGHLAEIAALLFALCCALQTPLANLHQFGGLRRAVTAEELSMTQFADMAFSDLQGEGVDLYAANYTGTNIRFCISSAGNSERCPGQSVCGPLSGFASTKAVLILVLSLTAEGLLLGDVVSASPNYQISVLAFGISALGCWTSLILRESAVAPLRVVAMGLSCVVSSLGAVEQAISAFLHRGSYVLWLCISSFALGYGGIWAALLAGVTAIEFSYVELPVGFDPGA